MYQLARRKSTVVFFKSLELLRAMRGIEIRRENYFGGVQFDDVLPICVHRLKCLRVDHMH